MNQRRHDKNWFVSNLEMAQAKNWLFRLFVHIPILGTMFLPSACGVVNDLLMRVIARRTLGTFYEKHGASKSSLDAWFHEVSDAKWIGPQDIKRRYPSADILPGNRVVFNIKGNNYRLIVKISFEYQMVWIRFIGTHADYDKINANTI